MNVQAPLPPPYEPTCTDADIDNNGQVNQTDATLVSQAINKPDINNDGNIDGDDKALMNRVLNSLTIY